MIWKSVLGGAGLAVLGLVAVILFNTMNVESRVAANAPAPVTIAFDETAAAHRLAQAVRFRTVSVGRDQPVAEAAFRGLHDYLAASFPRVHTTLKRETVNGYSLLYTWKGKDPSLKPILFSAHMDVVPIEPGTEDAWLHPPFAGVIADGFVWGRGTMDNKVSVIAMIEAAEYLIDQGFTPERTIYLAYGHDEEIGGAQGAAKITNLLQLRGVRLSSTLDEGLVITDGIVPGVAKPAALIGLAEKGQVTLRLRAFGKGGHASRPSMPTAIGKLAVAITRLENRQMPARLGRPVSDMFDALAQEMPFASRVVLANRWISERFLISRLERAPATNASIRTTTAPTIVTGGVKSNVLPSEASAVIDFRILPGDTVADVIAHARAAIDDPDVIVQIIDGHRSEPSPISKVTAAGYATLTKSIQQVFPDVAVAPGMVIGATDTRHYVGLAENSYRFVPMRLKADDIQRIHGTNERIAINNYADIVRFYVQVVRNTAS